MERSDDYSIPNLRGLAITKGAEERERENSDTNPSYSILDEAQIRQGQEDDIARVSSVLCESRASAIVLLRRFNWNLSKLFDNWYDDEPGVRNNLGLFASPIVDSASSDRPITCGICFETFRHSAVASASCGHLYCKACWSSYIAKSISDDGSGCLTLTCPDPSCVAAVGEDMVGALAASHSDREKFSRYLTRSYIEDSYRKTKIRWCPAPNCTYAVDFTAYFSAAAAAAGGLRTLDVECRCSHSFCWNCGGDVHRPVGCAAAAEWTAKSSNESESANWILVNTKPCPKCQRPIEKNHGCNHMKCAAPCRHEFCWHCLGQWSSKAVHYCRSLPDENVEAQRRKAATKSSLSKYCHYYEQWAWNLRSRRKAEADLRALQGERLERLRVKYGQHEESFGFIVRAWRQMIRCRRVLQWSCVYGYYFPEDQPEKKQFLEHLQREAESCFARLEDCAELEKDLADKGSVDDFLDYRQRLTELTFVIGNYFENLVDALEDGLSEVAPLYWLCKSCSSANSFTPGCYLCYKQGPPKPNLFEAQIASVSL